MNLSMIPELSSFLKYGLIGLGGIVSVLAFYLITQEQKKKQSHRSTSNLIYAFMIFGIVICIIGLFAPQKGENTISIDSPSVVKLPDNTPTDNNKNAKIGNSNYSSQENDKVVKIGNSNSSSQKNDKVVERDNSNISSKLNEEKCTVQTGLMTNLMNKADLFNASKLTTLPQNETFDVLDSKIYNHGGLAKIHFFKVKYNNIEGWVNERELDTISPKCLE